jgi:hypothetical protein
MTKRRITLEEKPAKTTIAWAASLGRMKVGDTLPIKNIAQSRVGGVLARFNKPERCYVSKRQNSDTVLVIKVK